MGTLICEHCGSKIRKNIRLKHRQQRYCSDKACQTARKLLSERTRYQTDASYRAKRLQHSRDRFKTKEARMARASYQRAYRASHPDYVRTNRQKQRVRNALCGEKSLHETQIVNPDTLMLQRPDSESFYAMIPVDYAKIVNPDTLMPYIADIETHTAQKPLLVRLL